MTHGCRGDGAQAGGKAVRRRRRDWRLFGARVNQDVHRLAKIDAARHGEKLNDWIEDAAVDKLTRRSVLKGAIGRGHTLDE